MLILIGVVVGIIAGLVGIVTGVVRYVDWRKGIARHKKLLRAELRAADEAEAKRRAQRLRVAKKNRATAELMQATRARSVIPLGEDPWVGTHATGYGEVIRNDLRRRGITPAGYVRGER